MTKLWLVDILEEDWDYDKFVSAAVWAESAEQAEELVRAASRGQSPHSGTDRDEPWVKPEWRLVVTPAPTEGLVLTHWHAG